MVIIVLTEAIEPSGMCIFAFVFQAHASGTGAQQAKCRMYLLGEQCKWYRPSLFVYKLFLVPQWWNGRHARLKIW